MADHRRGEKDIKLNGISYKLILDNSVLSEYTSMTGRCFVNHILEATDAYNDSLEFDSVLKRCAIQSSAVSRNDAATLIYLAAKKGNSQVQFEEIQEALLDDLDLTNEKKFYPALFVDLGGFAIAGAIENNSKKKE